MDLHERQQFDFLLQVAVERYVERMGHVGPERVKIGRFVDAIFNDFLLDNADGACFVLRALANQNAAYRFCVSDIQTVESPLRHSGEVLQGRMMPNVCPAFGKERTPLGATMVSGEGTCAAYYNYDRFLNIAAIR